MHCALPNSIPLACAQVCRVIRAFDPVHAAKNLTPDGVAALSIIKPIANLIKFEELQRELPIYLSRAADVSFDSDDAAKYTECVLSFWASMPNNSMREWIKAARIAFAITPNSASCERVFSLLNVMWSESQVKVLADAIQASLMLRYNHNMRAA